MIRKLMIKDKENWSKLYNGYADFYKAPMNTEVLETLWEWIHDDNHIVNGICFELEGKIVGVAMPFSVMSHASTGTASTCCKLCPSPKLLIPLWLRLLLA